MIEMLDVLNENGVRTGNSKSRTECHELGLWHRAVILAIVNDDNKILLQQRGIAASKFPGMWDLSAAGHVQAGESSKNTIMREAYEEIGIQCDCKDFEYVTCFRSLFETTDRRGGE